MTVIEMAKRDEEVMQPVFSLKENQIQKAVMDLLAAEHIYALRLNTASQLAYDGHGKSRMIRSHSGGRGVADILAVLQTSDDSRLKRILWIECKRQGGKQSPEQLSFQEHVESMGHYYLLAFDVSDVLNWLRKYEAVS